MTPSGSPLTVTVELLRDLAAGKLEALEALYDQFAECLYGLAMRICSDEARAGGIVEQVFTEVWDHRDHSVEISRFVPGMLARCRDLSLGSRSSLGLAPEVPPVSRSVPDVRRPMLPVLDRLSAEARAALEIAYFEGLPLDAIAARTGSTRSRVLEQLRNSLEELRPLLEGGSASGARP